MQNNPDGTFPPFNGPQISAIGAALTRRVTMIQGPPGKIIDYLQISILISFQFSQTLISSFLPTIYVYTQARVKQQSQAPLQYMKTLLNNK